jgi:hypothetical protein
MLDDVTVYHKQNRQRVSDLFLPGSPHPKIIASWSTGVDRGLYTDRGLNWPPVANKQVQQSWKEQRESPLQNDGDIIGLVQVENKKLMEMNFKIFVLL